MTKIYIAGPMTGLPEFNYPTFNAAAAELRALGHVVFNPAENRVPACGSWAGYMRQALAQLLQCEAIYLLPGWIRSKGARLESRVATDLGLVRMYSPAEAERMARLATAIAEAQAQGSRVAVVEGSPVFFSCEGDHEAPCESSNTQQCDECEGFGTVSDSKDDCPSCGGDGWVYASDARKAP